MRSEGTSHSKPHPNCTAFWAQGEPGTHSSASCMPTPQQPAQNEEVQRTSEKKVNLNYFGRKSSLLLHFGEKTGEKRF